MQPEWQQHPLFGIQLEKLSLKQFGTTTEVSELTSTTAKQQILSGDFETNVRHQKPKFEDIHKKLIRPLGSTEKLEWIRKIWHKEKELSDQVEEIEILVWFPKEFYRIFNLPIERLSNRTVDTLAIYNQVSTGNFFDETGCLNTNFLGRLPEMFSDDRPREGKICWRNFLRK